jgi:hypothetical protein
MLLLLGAAAGCSCAKKEEVSALKAQVSRLRETTEQSLNVANEARQIAEDSKSRSLRTEQAMNRTYKKSLQK